MLRIDLSGMSRAELRRLLAAAEARGQVGLAETFRAELAARASGEKGRPPPPPPILDDDEEPGPIVVRTEPPPLPFELTGRRAPSAGRWPVGLAAAAAGLVVGGAAVWGLSGAPGWPGGEGAETPAPRAMTARSAPTPKPAPATAPPRSLRRPADAPVPEPLSPEPAPPAPPSRESPPPPKPTALATAPSARRVTPAPEPGPRRVDPCAQPPTPADRLLCNDLALNLLERELRDAYGRALSAGADPAVVRQSQAAWRRARDPTSDPRALAGLYDRRIRELRVLAAGAAAQQGSEGAAPEPPPPPRPEDRQ